MPWLPPTPTPCVHPSRPQPARSDVGRIWQCPDCLKKWLVVIDHFGHDIMPGELTYQLRWKAEP